MRILTVKRGLAALATLAVLALLAFAALPWIASTQIVRDRIAYELSLWSGYRVSLGAAPVLDVWPGFEARLENVAFHEWASDGQPPVLEAESLEVTLSPLAALRGNVVLSGMSLHRPLLRLSMSGSVIDLPASPGGGRMIRAVEVARRVVAENPSSPDAGALPDPSLNRGARLVATGIWRGENVAVEASATSPLLLMAGGSTTVNASFKAPLVEASFEGVANLSGEAYFEGPAKLSSPSIRRMLEWSQTRIAPGAAIGAMTLASRVQGNARRLRLDQTALTLGGNTGRGVLDLSFADPVPAISGTLAFDKLDLRSFLLAFTPGAPGTESLRDRIDTAFSDQLSLDLRLSSAAATLGGVALTDIAASAQVKGTLAAFDVSDATAFGGEVQAGLRIDGAGEEKTVEMRLMANNVDAFALAKAAGAERLLPQGRATMSVMLKGAGGDWETALRRAEGSVSASLGQGALVGLDLAKFRTLWSGGGFFPLTEVAGGTLPLRGLDFKARIAGGVARIEKANATLDQRLVLSLAGIVHYFGRALALSGYFTPLAEDGSRGEAEMPFFVGGAWDTPFVSPAPGEFGFE